MATTAEGAKTGHLSFSEPDDAVIFGALQKGETATYQATFTATLSTEETESVEYAAQPPNSFALKIPSATGTNEYVQNGTGSYSCTQPNASSSQAPPSPWACVDLGFPKASTENGWVIVNPYQSKYWLGFLTGLKRYSKSAGFSESTSKMTVDAMTLDCVKWPEGVQNRSYGTVCVTSRGIPGYVHQGSTNFELQSLSPTVPSSTFELPAGAKVTTPGGSATGSSACNGTWSYANGVVSASVTIAGPAIVTFQAGSVSNTANVIAGQNHAAVSMTVSAPPTAVSATVSEPNGATAPCTLTQQGG